MAARVGGAASGTTCRAVKRKRSSSRVVPEKIASLIRCPVPSAAMSPLVKTRSPPRRSSVWIRKRAERSPSATRGSETLRIATTRE